MQKYNVKNEFAIDYLIMLELLYFYLNNGFGSVDFQNLATSFRSVCQSQVHNLRILWELKEMQLLSIWLNVRSNTRNIMRL